jgi:hypothetical protein
MASRVGPMGARCLGLHERRHETNMTKWASHRRSPGLSQADRVCVSETLRWPAEGLTRPGLCVSPLIGMMFASSRCTFVVVRRRVYIFPVFTLPGLGCLLPSCCVVRGGINGPRRTTHQPASDWLGGLGEICGSHHISYLVAPNSVCRISTTTALSLCLQSLTASPFWQLPILRASIRSNGP